MKIVALAKLGARVVDLTPVEAASLPSDSETWLRLGEALATYQVLFLHGDCSINPSVLRLLNLKMHRSLGLEARVPTATRQRDSGTNLHGASPEGFPEMSVLGKCRLADWHGLSGKVWPTSWWEEGTAQFHHDGGFSGSSRPPPPLVQMYCELAPTGDEGGTLELPTGGLPYTGGATLFFSTRLDRIPDAAHRMTCYYSTGFGKIREGVYPKMRASCVTPERPASSHDSGYRSVTDDASDVKSAYHHALVQGDAIMVHSVALDFVVDELTGTALSPQDSLDFIERLLAPAAKPESVLSWSWTPGDLCFFDNRSVQHSVTPTKSHPPCGKAAYAATDDVDDASLARLLTRAHLDCDWCPTPKGDPRHKAPA